MKKYISPVAKKIVLFEMDVLLSNSPGIDNKDTTDEGGESTRRSFSIWGDED